MTRFFRFLLIAVVAAVSVCCSRIDDDRIPPANVNIVFTTQGMWDRYGVGGALDARRFIRTSSVREPSDFPYTAATYTGYGGVLLVGDLYGNPIAYDLACPYEAKATVRIVVDHEANNAYCPQCHSVYDIYGGDGRPLAGPSAERGYGLTRYRVLDGGGMNYRFITR